MILAYSLLPLPLYMYFIALFVIVWSIYIDAQILKLACIGFDISLLKLLSIVSVSIQVQFWKMFI